MTKAKKIVAAVVCVAVVAGGGTGGTLLYQARQAKKNRVTVVPVSNLVQYNWSEDLSMDGQVTSGDTQNVVLSDSQLVEKVLVKEGDTVTKGTPLLEYDMTAVALEVAQKKSALAVAEDNVRQAEKELERLKKLKTAEQAPVVPDVDPDDEPDVDPDNSDSEPDTPDAPDTPVNTLSAVTALGEAAAGTGTSADPYQFACVGTTVVRQSVLDSLKSAGQYAIFVVYDNSGKTLYGWLVNGSTLTETADWTLGKNVTVTSDGGVQITGGGTWYGTLQVGGTFAYDPANKSEESSQSEETKPAETEPLPETTIAAETQIQTQAVAQVQPAAWISQTAASSEDSDNYVYTKAQLKQKIAEQEIEIQSKQIEQKKAQIEYDSATEKQDSGQELAKIDGTVTKIAASAESLEKDEPYLVVQGGGSVMVTGSVSEMNLDKLTVGSQITVNSWDTGGVYTAEVTEVGTTPSAYTTQTGMENPNNSTYPFKATVTDEATDLAVGNYVSLSFATETDESTFYLAMSYVRQENGQYYVMKESENHTLVRQNIRTGKIIDSGYSIEILSGLSQEDFICFPYGKYAKEGASVKESDSVSEE